MPEGAGRRSIALAGGGAVPAEVTLPRGFRPRTTPAVVLAPGAGSDLAHPFLATLAGGLGAAGYVAVRFDFPYRAAGRRRPDPAPVLERCWAAVLAAVIADPALAPPWVAIGGRSLGGRIASHLAAAGLPAAVRALVLLGYPLHPAGRPAALRAAHLPAIRIPTLFVKGTRDALAPLERLEPVVARMPAAALHVVDGADHGFHVPRRSGRTDGAAWGEVVAAVVRFLAPLR
ncbi:MAG TPA: alpha/beta family hydrolase [Candidatus Binatia bacterium]|nr:alpha/beta family hydrolase [Candidatus Binatia bacterium]